MNNQYIIFVENNRKNFVSYISYLQYNGNEEELKKLYTYIKAIEDYEASGEMSEFSMDLEHKFSEEIVNQVIKTNEIVNVSYTSFEKFVGKFTCPINGYEDDSVDDLFELVNDKFYYSYCKFKQMFN